MGKGEDIKLKAGDLIHVLATDDTPPSAGILMSRFNLTGEVRVSADFSPSVCWCWEIYWIGGGKDGRGDDQFEIEQNIFDALRSGRAKFYKNKKEEENGERHIS
tara:strand:- start:355 stop:666 length:312 start_codon:yes stop_codon:yes gene_type:complete